MSSYNAQNRGETMKSKKPDIKVTKASSDLAIAAQVINILQERLKTRESNGTYCG